MKPGARIALGFTRHSGRSRDGVTELLVKAGFCSGTLWTGHRTSAPGDEAVTLSQPPSFPSGAWRLMTGVSPHLARAGTSPWRDRRSA